MRTQILYALCTLCVLSSGRLSSFMNLMICAQALPGAMVCHLKRPWGSASVLSRSRIKFLRGGSDEFRDDEEPMDEEDDNDEEESEQEDETLDPEMPDDNEAFFDVLEETEEDEDAEMAEHGDTSTIEEEDILQEEEPFLEEEDSLDEELLLAEGEYFQGEGSEITDEFAESFDEQVDAKDWVNVEKELATEYEEGTTAKTAESEDEPDLSTQSQETETLDIDEELEENETSDEVVSDFADVEAVADSDQVDNTGSEYADAEVEEDQEETEELLSPGGEDLEDKSADESEKNDAEGVEEEELLSSGAVDLEDKSADESDKNEEEDIEEVEIEVDEEESLEERHVVLIEYLKYTREEIEHMRPDIAAELARNRIKRPSSGVPPDWFVDGYTPIVRKRSFLKMNSEESTGRLKKMLKNVVLAAIVGGVTLTVTQQRGGQPSASQASSHPSPQTPEIVAQVEEEKAHEASLTEEQDLRETPEKETATGKNKRDKFNSSLDETWLDKGITAVMKLIDGIFSIKLW